MNKEMLEYTKKVNRLIFDFSNYIDADGLKEVKILADNNEHGEAILSLAWVIHNTKKNVPKEYIKKIIDLSEGLVSEEHMPPDFYKIS